MIIFEKALLRFSRCAGGPNIQTSVTIDSLSIYTIVDGPNPMDWTEYGTVRVGPAQAGTNKNSSKSSAGAAGAEQSAAYLLSYKLKSAGIISHL